MPNMQRSQLSGMQLGRYAEYYAKMEFTSYGFEVYTSEVDDHGVDFVAKQPKTSEFYEGRRSAGLPVEKKNSIFAKGGYTDKEAERNILANPFKRFENMQMIHHTKMLGIVQVDESVWKYLSKAEKAEINQICDKKLDDYYGRMARK